jgi:hypothetical protein
MRNLAEHQTDVLEQHLLAMTRSEDYHPIVAALCTQRGVGALSAIRFILELGDVRRFPTADSIGHYLGQTGDRRARLRTPSPPAVSRER